MRGRKVEKGSLATAAWRRVDTGNQGEVTQPPDSRT